MTMMWKLRIPLMLLVFGMISAMYQFFPFTQKLPWFLYLGLIGLIIWFLEKTEINEKKVHFSIGIVLISIGLFIDYVV